MSRGPWGTSQKPKPIKTHQQRDDIPEISYYLDPNNTGGPTKGYIDETGAVNFVNREREKEKNG
jgi:hypothetical protein